MSLCTSIELVRNVNNTDLLKVVIDNTIEAYWFYSHADALQYIGKDVIVEFRKDILDGNIENFIKTFVEPSKVNVLERKDNIKLYVDQEDNNSNLSFNEIADGETRGGCIMYCISSSFNSSDKAAWQELLVRDKCMHTTKLRIFNYENVSADFTGQYVLAEITRNKYGFKADAIYPANGICKPNPEIDIAKEYISNYFGNDMVAMSYLTQTNLIEHMMQDIDYEPGYGLVRLAMELSMIDAMNNITKDIDLVAIGQALLASRGYLVRNSVLSNSFNNMAVAMQLQWPNKTLVLQLLDESLEDKPKAYTVYKSVKDTVDTLLKVRKGLEV